MSIKNILVPIDFSENALNGLNVACNLGKKLNARLHLVSAFHVPAPLTDVGGAPQMIGTFISEYKDEIEENLDELEEHVPGLKEVEYDKDVYLASTADAIYTAIEAQSIDLIVMGTRKNHTGIEHLLGGVSTDVIRFATCPVLVIPEEFRDFAPRKIALAVDNHSEENSAQLAILEDLCRTFDASLTIVHIQTASDSVEAGDFTYKSSGGISFRYETLPTENVEQSLIRYVEANEMDLLVMMPRKHGLFDRIFNRSITKKVALEIGVPLLTVHE